MKRIICFGEIMMRLNPEGYLRFAQADKFMTSYAGAEANVAASLANFGMKSYFISKVPNHEIGQASINQLRRYGVDTSKVLRGGDRLGIYFVEKGASQRGSKVIYDRKYSAVSMAQPSEYDWEDILSGADWFHFTGVTPALSEGAAKACIDACRYAKESNITVSCDLNYRKNLWSQERAENVMTELMQYVDVCIANEEDAHNVFGIAAEATDVNAGLISNEGYIKVAQEIQVRFGCKKVAITLRESFSANDNNWSAMLYEDKVAYFSKKYLIHIVDRVGGGDSFGGALIYCLLEGKDPQTAIDFATAASCLKQTIEYDFNHVSIAEVESLMKGNVSGRVMR
jgi:2-dehydro-3-deoxygluconokinase